MQESVTSILYSIHEKIKSSFNQDSANGDQQQAKIIENFLRELKRRAFEVKTDPAIRMSENIYDLILNNISLPNGRTMGNLFQRTGKSYQQGMYFEDDLAAVLQSVVQLATGEKQKRSVKNFKLGAEVGTTDIDLMSTLEENVDDVKLNLLDKTQQEIDKKKIPYTFGKIDTYIKGDVIAMNGSINFPPGLLEALSNATFTDKSYRSVTYKDGTKIQLGDREITLGNSDPYRAVLGSMTALGFNKTTFQHVFYGGRNILVGQDNTPPKELPDDVAPHFYHLRYIYELTGAGIYYKDYGEQFLSGAKFLVYNDPSSLDITVVSTKKIISDMIFNNQQDNKNALGSIGISTALLKNM